jgi:3-hydroxybutyrate dehydrogenase
VALEAAATGITCNALCPGTLPTPAIQAKIAAAAVAEGHSVEQATSDYLATRQPSRRFVATDGVGAMVVFLSSEAARDITGTTIPIDGGWAVA